jgi:ComF family protein
MIHRVYRASSIIQTTITHAGEARLAANSWTRALGSLLPRCLPRFSLGLLPDFLPRLCLLCEWPCGAEPLCRVCGSFLPGAGRARCQVCARPWQVSSRCASCRAIAPAFDASVTAADYSAPLDRALTALKFSGQIGLASGLGALLADAWLGGNGREPQQPAVLDCLVPIPLSNQRLAERGFNQAHLIAAAMLKRLKEKRAPASAATSAFPLPYLHPALLVRPRETLAQSLLQWDARQANLDHGFIAAAPAAGLRIGIVDDVMTTGATLQAAALALKAAGAARVVNLVVARTA